MAGKLSTARNTNRRRDLPAEFLTYCTNNQLDQVRACLTLSVSPNTVTDDNKWSGLSIAASNNYEELLDILISQHDIDINIVTKYLGKYKWTALMFACKRGHHNIVSRLVTIPGIDIQYEDSLGRTAAHYAADWGHSQCITILAQTGLVNWNSKTSIGWTPLYIAVMMGHHDIVDIITQQDNIYYSVLTKDGVTLAQAVVRKGNARSVELLARKELCECWNTPDKAGDTPVFAAIKNNKDDIVDILVDCPRVDLTCRDSQGWSVLMRLVAAKKIGEENLLFRIIFRPICFLDVVRKLVSPVDRPNAKRSTLVPIIQIISLLIDLVKAILRRLPRNHTGQTLARLAVEVGDTEDIQRLINQSCPINWDEKTESEDPAVFLALQKEKLKIARLRIPLINMGVRNRNNPSVGKYVRLGKGSKKKISGIFH